MMNYIQNKVNKRIMEVVVLVTIFSTLLLVVPQAEAIQDKAGLAWFGGEMGLFPVSHDAEPYYTMSVNATAYSSDPNQTDSTPCVPASGMNLCQFYELYGLEDTIASNFLPLGTKVRFPDLYGEKVFTVRDRMNARYNGTNRIDFWVGSSEPTSKEIIKEAKDKAIAFGYKQGVRMEVYYK